MSPILERLYALMRERGVNGKQVSETLHLSNSAFTDWKKGRAKPGVENLSKLAEYFGVSLDYLVFGKETVPTPEVIPESNERISVNSLDDSSLFDEELRIKLRRLPPEYQGKVMAYIDGMLAALPSNAGRMEAPTAKQEEPVPEGPNEDGGKMPA